MQEDRGDRAPQAVSLFLPIFLSTAGRTVYLHFVSSHREVSLKAKEKMWVPTSPPWPWELAFSQATKFNCLKDPQPCEGAPHSVGQLKLWQCWEGMDCTIRAGPCPGGWQDYLSPCLMF